MSSAGRLTQCDCRGIGYFLPINQFFGSTVYYFFIIDKMASRAVVWRSLIYRIRWCLLFLNPLWQFF